MRIEKLKTSPDRVGRYTVCFEDGSVMRLYRQNVEDFGLYSGKELSEAEYEALQTAAGEMSARMRAVRIISASNVSRRDLEKRLIQKGEKEDDARHAVNWLEDLNLVDDRHTAEQIVHSCINKGYGLSRAKQVLFEKRIPKDLWDDVLSEYPDQTEYILSFLRSRLGSGFDQKDIKRAIDALMRRGHSYNSIRKALSELSAEADDYMEDY